MSKGLEALENIRKNIIFPINNMNYEIEDYCNDTDIIEKELKVLEIIKNTLGIRLFETTEDNTLGETHYYIDIGGVVSYQLKSKEEYDLLKEVLLWV